MGADAALRGWLRATAKGGSLVVDYFTSRRCSVTIGDLTAEVRPNAPGRGYVELAPVEGVRVYAEVRRLPLLRHAGPSLRLARGVLGRHVAVSLDRPEQWIAFLEGPGVLARRSTSHSGPVSSRP